MFVEPVDNLCGRFALGIHGEDGLYGFCPDRLYFILPVFSYLITKTGATHSDTMKCIFFETSLDTPGKVFRIVFGISFKHRFQYDSFRGVRHRLFRIVDFDPIFLELRLIDS